MITSFRRVTIVKIRKPPAKVVNEDLQWFCSSLGLFSMRDKNSSCFRVFIELLKAARHDRAISSDELAARLELTRGTVVHHLNKLISAGLITTEGNSYILRVSNLEELVDVVHKDTLEVFDNLKQVAKDLDDDLGLEKRE